MNDKFNSYWDFLIDWGFFTEEELNLISAMNGATVETLNDAVFARFGYRNVEDLDEEYSL